MRLSVILADVVGAEGDRMTTVIGWCVCLQCESSEKSNSTRIIRGSLYGSVISAVSVKILMSNQLEKSGKIF